MPYHSIKDILNICKNDECEFWQVVLTEQTKNRLLLQNPFLKKCAACTA